LSARFKEGTRQTRFVENVKPLLPVVWVFPGEGEFGYSLNVTDIQTTWTETRALLGKGQTAVQQALDEIEGMLPFRLLGLDSDNGSEFINWHLKAWCERK